MPGLDMMPRQNPDDHEAAMARADLYKLANYSMKLFKMIQDGDQLEGWVQAKITKAADYVASVYHFMEYEMKFSEYGEKLETSDMYTEEVKNQFKAKLIEARIKLDKLSKVLEGGSKPDYIDIDKDGNKKEPMKKAVADKKKGSVKNSSKVSEDWPGTKEYKEKHGTEKERYQAKYGKDDELEKEYADRKKKGGYGKLGPSGSDTEEEPAKTKPGRGRKKSNETVISNPVASKTNIPATARTSVPGKRATQLDLKKANSSAALGEAKPSAGMTKGEKSAVVKKAKSGGDIGKPGKGFAKVEKSAKASGAKDPKAVAAAAMWKQQAKK